MSTVTDLGTQAPAIGVNTGRTDESAKRQNVRTIAYRPEIDGLRAVAVLSVLLYHAFPQLLPGGFVGVDIFFVISGFLITSIILEEQASGQFSFARFYERRARRLLPPLAPVLIATVLLCFLFQSKEQLPSFADSIGANAIFMSNWYFLSKISYFDGPGAYTPLLHTWSLSVEEQFYFVFPTILLIALKINGRWLRYVCFGLLAASFSYASYLIWNASVDVAFYDAAARFWELLVGASLAIIKPGQFSRRQALALGLVGLAAIFVALFSYHHEIPFPGPSAALPVLGTALVILSSNSVGVVQRVLSARPLVGIGLISYALYLWHWPLLVALRLINPNPGPAWVVGVLLVAGLFACGSFWLIERPVRMKRTLRTRHSVWIFSFMLLTVMYGTNLAQKTPRIQRIQQAVREDVEQALYPKEKVALLKRLEVAKKQYMKTLNLNFNGKSAAYSAATHAGWTCSYDKSNSVDRLVHCLIAQAGKENTILVMGDSIGRDTLHALRIAFPRQQYIMLHASGCPPGKPTCFRDLPEILSRIKASITVKAVFMNFRYRPVDYLNVERGIDAAKGLTPNVFLFGISPMFTQSMPDYIKSLKSRQMPPMAISADTGMIRWDYGRLLDAARNIAKKHEAVFVNVFPFFCPQRDTCRLWVDDRYGRPIFWDNQHLTPEGIRSFAEYLRRLPELQIFLKDVEYNHIAD